MPKKSQLSYYPTISATSFSIIESRIISKSSHIGINYLSSWKFQKFHIPLTVIQLTHTRIIHPSHILLSYRLNRNPSRSNFIDRDVIIERKPNREKKIFIHLDHFESSRGKQTLREKRSKASRSMHHALPPPSPMNQFENSPVQSDRPRSSGHTLALYPMHPR